MMIGRPSSPRSTNEARGMFSLAHFFGSRPLPSENRSGFFCAGLVVGFARQKNVGPLMFPSIPSAPRITASNFVFRSFVEKNEGSNGFLFLFLFFPFDFTGNCITLSMDISNGIQLRYITTSGLNHLLFDFFLYQETTTRKRIYRNPVGD